MNMCARHLNIDLEEFTNLVYQGLTIKQIYVKMFNYKRNDFGHLFKLQHGEYPSVYIHKIKEQMKYGKNRTTKSADITT